MREQSSCLKDFNFSSGTGLKIKASRSFEQKQIGTSFRLRVIKTKNDLEDSNHMHKARHRC